MLILFLFSRENQTPHISYMIQILIEQHPPAGWCWQSYTSQVFKTLVLSSGFFFEMCFHFQTVKGFVSVPSSARGCDDDFLVSWAAQNGQKGRLFWHNNLKNKWPRKLYYASNWLSDQWHITLKSKLKLVLKKWCTLFQVDSLQSSNKKLSSQPCVLVFIVLGTFNSGSSLKTRLKCAANEHFTGEMHQKIPQSHL